MNIFKGFTFSKRECFLFDVEKSFFFSFPVNLNNLLDFLVERPQRSYTLDVAFVRLMIDCRECACV